MSRIQLRIKSLWEVRISPSGKHRRCASEDCSSDTETEAVKWKRPLLSGQSYLVCVLQPLCHVCSRQAHPDLCSSPISVCPSVDGTSCTQEQATWNRRFSPVSATFGALLSQIKLQKGSLRCLQSCCVCVYLSAFADIDIYPPLPSTTSESGCFLENERSPECSSKGLKTAERPCPRLLCEQSLVLLQQKGLMWEGDKRDSERMPTLQKCEECTKS